MLKIVSGDPAVVAVRVALLAFGAWYGIRMLRRWSQATADDSSEQRRPTATPEGSALESEARIRKMEQFQLGAICAFAIGLAVTFVALIAGVPLWAAWTVAGVANGIPLLVYIIAEVLKTWWFLKSLK